MPSTGVEVHSAGDGGKDDEGTDLIADHHQEGEDNIEQVVVLQTDEQQALGQEEYQEGRNDDDNGEGENDGDEDEDDEDGEYRKNAENNVTKVHVLFIGIN